MGIIEIGQVMLSDAARRLETNAQNVANVTTPGYRAGSSFPLLLRAIPSDDGSNAQGAEAIDFKSGQVRQTGSALDLAVEGDGFLVFGDGDAIVYSRNGQLKRDADGRLVNGAGLALQGETGTLVVRDDNPEILADGTVLDLGEPVGRIRLAAFQDSADVRRQGSGFVTSFDNVRAVEGVRIGQGMLEASNVSMAHEILSIMQVQRSAETGQHLVQVYDDLMARALSTFGQS